MALSGSLRRALCRESTAPPESFWRSCTSRLEDEGLDVVRVGLEDFGVQFGGFVEAVFQNQELDVVLLNLERLWDDRCTVKCIRRWPCRDRPLGSRNRPACGSLPDCRRDLSWFDAETIRSRLFFPSCIRRRTRAARGAGFLGSTSMACLNCCSASGKLIARLIEAAQGELRVHGLGIVGGGLLEILLRFVRQVFSEFKAGRAAGRTRSGWDRLR